MLAAESGHADTIELLLRHHADANESNLVRNYRDVPNTRFYYSAK